MGCCCSTDGVPGGGDYRPRRSVAYELSSVSSLNSQQIKQCDKLSRPETIRGVFATESSPLAQSWSRKFTLFKASVKDGINDDPDQFKEEIEESAPELRHFEKRRIREWIDLVIEMNKGHIHDEDRFGVPGNNNNNNNNNETNNEVDSNRNHENENDNDDEGAPSTPTQKGGHRRGVSSSSVGSMKRNNSSTEHNTLNHRNDDENNDSLAVQRPSAEGLSSETGADAGILETDASTCQDESGTAAVSESNNTNNNKKFSLNIKDGEKAKKNQRADDSSEISRNQNEPAREGGAKMSPPQKHSEEGLDEKEENEESRKKNNNNGAIKSVVELSMDQKLSRMFRPIPRKLQKRKSSPRDAALEAWLTP